MMRSAHTRTVPLPDDLTRYNLSLSKEHNALLLKLRSKLTEDRQRNVPLVEVIREAIACLAKQENVTTS